MVELSKKYETGCFDENENEIWQKVVYLLNKHGVVLVRIRPKYRRRVCTGMTFHWLIMMVKKMKYPNFYEKHYTFVKSQLVYNIQKLHQLYSTDYNCCINYNRLKMIIFSHYAMYYSQCKSLKAQKYFKFCLKYVVPNEFAICLCYEYAVYLCNVLENYNLSLQFVLLALKMFKCGYGNNLVNKKIAYKISKFLRFRLVKKIGLNSYCHNKKCHKKFSFGKNGRCCSGCKIVFYCSKKCQKNDWKGGHCLTCCHCY